MHIWVFCLFSNTGRESQNSKHTGVAHGRDPLYVCIYIVLYGTTHRTKRTTNQKPYQLPNLLLSYHEPVPVPCFSEVCASDRLVAYASPMPKRLEQPHFVNIAAGSFRPYSICVASLVVEDNWLGTRAMISKFATAPMRLRSNLQDLIRSSFAKWIAKFST